MKIESYGAGVMNAQDARVTRPMENANRTEIVKTVNNENRVDNSQTKVIDDDMLENSLKQANKNLEQYNRMIERTIHEKTHTIMYVLKDTITNEVIREFPPRKIQDMIAKMWEMAGILIDERR